MQRKFTMKETSDTEFFFYRIRRTISASLSKLKISKVLKGNWKKPQKRNPTKYEEKKHTLFYIWTQFHQKQAENIIFTPYFLCFCSFSFSILALWCNPLCGCSCTGRWTESSPAAQSKRLRGRFPEQRRCW